MRSRGEQSNDLLLTLAQPVGRAKNLHAPLEVRCTPESSSPVRSSHVIRHPRLVPWLQGGGSFIQDLPPKCPKVPKQRPCRGLEPELSRQHRSSPRFRARQR